MNISRPGRLAFATLSLTCLTVPAFAQEPGIRGTLSFDQRFDFSDNPDLLVIQPSDNKVRSTTELGFRLNSETRSEAFDLNVNGDAITAFGSGATDDDDLDFRNENASVSYSRSGANSRLSLGAQYSNLRIQDDVIGFVVDGVFEPNALVVDGGERRQIRYNGAFETGIDGPFGVSLSASVVDNEYNGTTDPDLFNDYRFNLDGLVRFQINPAVTGRALAGISNQETEDFLETERSTTYVGVGIEAETAGGVSYTGDLTLDRSETTIFGSVPSSETDGVGLTFSAVKERNDGELGFNLSSRVDTSGRRTSASVRRDFDLPDGALSFRLGLTRQEDSTTELTTALTYLRELPRGEFEATVTQQPTTEDGAAFLNTAINLNYNQSINAISSFDAGFSYGAASQFGSTGGDTRTTASLTYRRDLSEDWRLRAGVTATRIDDDAGNDRSRNSVFLSVGRDISFGF